MQTFFYLWCVCVCGGGRGCSLSYWLLLCAPVLVICSKMANGKKSTKTKKKPLPLKLVQSCVKITLDGKLRLDLSLKGIFEVPKSIQKLSDLDEVDLSRNLIRTIPDFIEYFIKITVLDLHSNYVSMIGTLQNLWLAPLKAVKNLVGFKLQSL